MALVAGKLADISPDGHIANSEVISPTS